MNRLENISYMYPYGYEDELSKQAAQRDELFERAARPAEDLTRGLGWAALAAMTGGIATGRFEQEAAVHSATEKQVRALGDTSLKYLTRTARIINTAVNETAVLGHATSQAA